MLNPSQSEHTGVPIYAAAKVQRAQTLDLMLSLANAKALMGSIYEVIFLSARGLASGHSLDLWTGASALPLYTSVLSAQQVLGYAFS